MTKGTTMEMEAMKDEEALAERMPWQQFVTKCPECGGQLYLSSYSVVLEAATVLCSTRDLPSILTALTSAEARGSTPTTKL